MPTPPFFVANDFTGADLGAKINNALTSATGLNGGPGEVLVVDTTSLGTATPPITTAVVVGPQQTVRFQPGNFSQTASITLRGVGARVTGAGATSTIVTNTSSSAASVVLDPGGPTGFQNNGMEVSDLTLSRDTGVSGGSPVVPTADAVGIDASVGRLPGAKNNLERVRIRDVIVTGATAAMSGGAYVTGYGHAVGVALGPTGFSWVDRSIVENSYYDNMTVANAGNVSGLNGYISQWQLSDLFFQNARNGSGLFVTTTAPAVGSGPIQMVLGTWTNLSTFGNAGNGLRLVGREDAPIQDLRVLGGFFGEDHLSEIYLDTHGVFTSIRDAFIELAGSPTANSASGIEITASNRDVSVTGCLIQSCNNNGILTSSPNTVVTGCDILNNGANASPSGSGRVGIYVNAGAAELVGNRSGNDGTSNQQFGMYCNTGSNVTATGNRFHSNTSAQIGGTPAQNVGNLLT